MILYQNINQNYIYYRYCYAVRQMVWYFFLNIRPHTLYIVGNMLYGFNDNLNIKYNTT